MNQLLKSKISLLFLFIFIGCQKMKPESVTLLKYPDLKILMVEQVKMLNGKSIEKTVSLNEKSESHTTTFDSLQWLNELDFLKEINPNQSKYVGAFEKIDNGYDVILNLKEKEKGILKYLKYAVTNRQFDYISATLHEDRNVYVHHQEISMKFVNNELSTYEINGYQKMILQDSVKFSIKGRIN